jgi:Ca2+:H+ antiporter
VPESRSSRAIARHTILLLANVLPIVLLAKRLDKIVTHGIDDLGAPVALPGC